MKHISLILTVALMSGTALAREFRCELPSDFSPQSHGRLDRQVTRLYVQKRQKKLFVFSGNEVLKIYHIALGPGWEKGPKHQQGDGATPGGRYYLDQLRNYSDYHRAFHISYPDADDVEYAREHRISRARIGGDIMLHGFPNAGTTMDPADPSRELRPVAQSKHFNMRESNWTAGCVAVTDAEIDELFSNIKKIYLDNGVVSQNLENVSDVDTSQFLPIDLCEE